jgi:ERCC4-type nuclease
MTGLAGGPPELRVAVDSREQLPWSFDKYPVKLAVSTLETGDYALEGFEDVAVIERKSLDDFLRSITHDRDRFFAEIKRGNALAEFVVIVEATYDDVAEGNYRQRVNPNAALGTVEKWSAYNKVRFIFARDRQHAQAIAYGLLFQWHEKYADLFI